MKQSSKGLPRLIRLNAIGFDHVLLPLACFVVFALIGSFYLYHSLAATSVQWKGVLEDYRLSSGYCLTTTGSTKASLVELDPCSKTYDSKQVWSLVDVRKATVSNESNVQEFYLQSADGGECIDNWGASEKTSYPEKLYPCSTTDSAVTWIWGAKFTSRGYSSHQLSNMAAASMCLDDRDGSDKSGTYVGLYTCKTTAQSNQEWFEQGAPSSSGSGSGSGSSGSGSSGSSSGFITKSGENFMLSGKVFKFIGFDAYGMSGCYSGSAWTSAQLDSYFASLPADGVTRLWAMKEYGTGPISAVLTAAAKYNQHVILTLSNSGSTCDSGDGPSSNKTATYFQTTYKTTLIPWINTIVPLFKNNKSVMMWEIMNEPAESNESIMKAFVQATSNAIRADDPNHLIALGADDASDLGGNSNFTADQDVPNIDAIGFHDYAWDYEGKAIESGNFSVAQSTAKTLDKPFYTGEAGVEGGSSCNGSNGLSLSARVTYLTTKANDYFNGGLSGILFWEYEPSQASWVSSCAYEMYPGDPMIAAVKNYKIP